MLIYLSFLLLLNFVSISATRTISASSFSTCGVSGSQISVSKFSFNFSLEEKSLAFQLEGTSSARAQVLALINITAYEIQAYSKTYDPCDPNYNITSLCPVKEGQFSANGRIVLPDEVLRNIPSLVFKVPDLQGFVSMNIVEKTGTSLTCVTAPVNNGKSLASPSAKIFLGSVAAGAIIASGAVSAATSLTAASTGVGISTGAGGMSGTSSAFSTSPNVGDIFMWFHAIGINGAFSVSYPLICQNFYKNYAIWIGMVEWEWLQKRIDTFRSKTGGSPQGSPSAHRRRSVPGSYHVMRSPSTRRKALGRYVAQRKQIAKRGTTPSQAVLGIQAYAQKLKIPNQNTFMTIFIVFNLVIVTIILLAIIIRIVLVFVPQSRLPRSLVKLKQHYWTSVLSLALRTMLLVYGTWCLFCLYQWKNGDSWAASLLAALSMAIMTGIIVWFSIRIFDIAMHPKTPGRHGSETLFHHKPYLRKYGLLYEQFKSRSWWAYIPLTVYSLLKATLIALADGHGLAQVAGCMACEGFLLAFLIWERAYAIPQANIVNISISVVRLISLLGTFLFVDILAFQETTKTAVGIAIIVLQSVMTVALTILILCNGILPLIKNRKQKAKVQDKATIDARASVEMLCCEQGATSEKAQSQLGEHQPEEDHAYSKQSGSAWQAPQSCESRPLIEKEKCSIVAAHKSAPNGGYRALPTK